MTETDARWRTKTLPVAERWLEMPWVNRYSNRQYRLTEEPFRDLVRPGLVRPRTYRDILSDYLANPEAKSLAPGGTPCAADTAGLLTRRQVVLKTATHIGKESNRLEDVQAGLIEDLDEVVNQYDDFYRRVVAKLVNPVLREVGVRETARRVRQAPSSVSAVLRGSARPRPASSQRYVLAAAAWARQALEALNEPTPADPVAILHRYLELCGTPGSPDSATDGAR